MEILAYGNPRTDEFYGAFASIEAATRELAPLTIVADPRNPRKYGYKVIDSQGSLKGHLSYVKVIE